MKKMMFTLFALLTIAATASAMSYEQARNEALFLTDKMAYELNLTNDQYEAAYEINLDYLMGVTSRYDVYGPYWERRNLDLNYILFSWQWDLFRAATYFYRPLYWDAGYWHFGVYARYPHRDYFYFGRPHFYASYRGGHSWRMNGGHSYYEHRRDFYRPNGHNRDNHFGMRNGFDRGDYRGGRMAGNSSTRHTQNGSFGHHGHNDNGNMGNGNQNNGNMGNGQHGNGQHGNGNTGNGNQNNGNVGNGTSHGSHGSFGASRTGNGSFGSSRQSTSGSVSAPTRTDQRVTTPQVQQRTSAPQSQLHSSVPQQQRSVTTSSIGSRSGSTSGSFGGSRSSVGSSRSSSSAPTRSSVSSGSSSRSSSSGSRSGSSGSRGHFGGHR